MADQGPQLSAADEAAVVAYADGRLDAERREALHARLDAEPELAAALGRQRNALTAIAQAVDQTSAPLALRARVEGLAAKPERVPWRERLGARLRIPAGLAAGAAVAAAALALVVLGGAPGIEDVAAAATRPPTAAIAPFPAGSKLLTERVEDVGFPNYAGKFGWKATGTRTDEIDGRRTRTVFYEKGGRRIAYTVVAGEALDQPGDAKTATREGTTLRTLADGGREIVTWRRNGNTCVISAKGVPESELLDLAGWKGMGAVDF